MPVISEEYEDFIEEYREFDIEQLYKLLFPYIRDDFMGKRDCANVHSRENLQVVVGEETGSINHLIHQGGDDTHTGSLARDYEQDVRDGDNRLSRAKETGEF